MQTVFPLSPRYRLDDELPWLLGIDPVRRYWLSVNGSDRLTVGIPGLMTSDFAEFKETILKFRNLAPGEMLTLKTWSQPTQVYCIATNCYAIPAEVAGAAVWHLFDRETLESLLMTAHPDWQCSAKDVELGRRLLSHSWQHSAVA